MFLILGPGSKAYGKSEAVPFQKFINFIQFIPSYI